MEDLIQKSPHYFLRSTDDWVRFVHETTTRNFSKAYHCLQQMHRSNLDTRATKTPNCAVQSFFQKICFDNVFAGAADSARNTRPDIFLGPMAVQMSRADLEKIQKHDYYITEKSDGFRVMLLHLRINSFPKYYYKNNANNSPNYACCNLFDNCMLEASLSYCAANNLTTLNIDLFLDNTFPASSNKNMNDERQKFILDTKTMTLTMKFDTNVKFHVKKNYGWNFTYLFDRKYTDFYLCTEEFVFPTSQSVKNSNPVHQRILLLDGEVVYNMRDQRYNYTVYDIVTCCITDPKNSSESKMISFRNLSTKDKLAAIRNNVVEPHHYYYKHCNGVQKYPQSLLVVIKHFYPKDRLKQVLDCITHDTKTGHFLYKGYNKNDGLVFTPNSSELYSFSPGANKYLIKWKWPEKLTADFLIQFLGVDYSENIKYFNFALYYHSMGRPMFYRIASIKQDNIKDRQFLETLLSLERSVDNTNSFIAECGFDKAENEWYVNNIRTDKNTSNGYYIILQNMENILEDITSSELENYCLNNTPNVEFDEDTTLANNADTVNQFIEALNSTTITKNIYTYFVMDFGSLKRNKNNSQNHQNARRLYLKYCMLNPNDNGELYVVEKDFKRHVFDTIITSSNNPSDSQHDKLCYYDKQTRTSYKLIFNDFCPLTEKCIGLNYECGEELENFALHALGQNNTNKGNKMFLQCLFIPKLGKYKIVDMLDYSLENQQKYLRKASTKSVLKSLENLTHIDYIVNNASDNIDNAVGGTDTDTDSEHTTLDEKKRLFEQTGWQEESTQNNKKQKWEF